jgi:Putative amidase domain
MFIKKFRVTKPNWFTVAKVISTVALLAIIVPIFSQQVQADAVCTEQLQKELRSKINTLDTLSKLKSSKELDIQSRDEFNKLQIQKYPSFEKFTSDIKSKIKKQFPASGNEKIEYDFTKLQLNNDILTGTFNQKDLYEYENGENGTVDTSGNLNYNIKTGEIKITKEKEFIPSNNQSAGEKPTVQENAKNLEKKALNEKNEKSVIKKDKIAFNKDNREEQKQSKIELEKQLENATCNGISAKAVSGGTYARLSAAWYANNYATLINDGYRYFPDGDCTNFASQALSYGGIGQDNINNVNPSYYNWFYNWYYNYSTSWTVVDPFASHMYDYENSGYWLDSKNSGYSIFDPLDYGDLLFADWEGNGSKDHTMIITSWDIVNGHWEPRLSYHTNNTKSIKLQDFINKAKAGGQNPNLNLIGLHMYNTIS